MKAHLTDAQGRPLPTFDVYYGEDGILVVHIDTEGIPENANGPAMRVYINDGDAVFDNSTEGDA